MHHLKAVGWPPNHIALALAPGIDVRGEDSDRASDLSMGAEEEVEPSALCPMRPGDWDLMTVLVEPCARRRVLKIDIDRAEFLRDDAYKRIGPALPPSANDCLIGAGVLKAPDSQWRLMAFGIGGDVLAWEHFDALSGETVTMINWCFAHGRNPGSNVLSPVTKPSRTSATRT